MTPHGHQWRWNRRQGASVSVLVAMLLCGATLLLAVSIGSVAISFLDIVTITWQHLLGVPQYQFSPATVTIVLTIRLPRVLLVALTGAALSATGAAYQGLFRNPLADPYIVGVASGAGLGAIATVAMGGVVLLGSLAMPIGAFVGALLVVAGVFGIAARRNAYSNNDLVLAGVALGTLASAVTTFLMIQLGRQTNQLLAFLLGSFATVGWDAVWVVATSVVVGMLLLTVVSRDLNTLLFSEEEAQFLGINVRRVRWITIGGATIMTATAVAFHGLIGFVGIIVPHSLRLWLGGDHRRLIPLSALYGSMFLLVADMLARTLIAPQELPLGIITAGIGAPFFLWQLLTSQRSIS